MKSQRLNLNSGPVAGPFVRGLTRPCLHSRMVAVAVAVAILNSLISYYDNPNNHR